jgi:hypothetical protein
MSEAQAATTPNIKDAILMLDGELVQVVSFGPIKCKVIPLGMMTACNDDGTVGTIQRKQVNVLTRVGSIQGARTLSSTSTCAVRRADFKRSSTLQR